jgi:hypothetical protein
MPTERYCGDGCTNGRTDFPVVSDPESYEINRLQLATTSLPGTTITAGRQRVIFDDERFISRVGWRQNEQTFDAVHVVNQAIPKLTIDSTYFNQVNRVLGKESVLGRYHGDSLSRECRLPDANRQSRGVRP